MVDPGQAVTGMMLYTNTFEVGETGKFCADEATWKTSATASRRSACITVGKELTWDGPELGNVVDVESHLPL